MEIFFIIIAIIIIILWVLIKPAKITTEHRKRLEGTYFAHRGLHTKDKTMPENSLAAFKAAVENGYGIEFDLQLSKDGQVMVFHDDDLKRVCGRNEKFCDLDAKELEKINLHETNQTIPYFKDLLETVNGKIPLMVEFKFSGERTVEICQKTYELLKEYKGEYFIESFDPHVLIWFKKNAPDIMRGQLTDAMRRYEGISLYQTFIISHVLFNIFARPHFIAHGLGKKTFTTRLCEAMGALKVCWTVNDTHEFKKIKEEYHSLIFEYFKP